MSKQYLTQHAVDHDAAFKVYSTAETDYPIAQSFPDAHTLGAHHVVANQAGTKAVTVGFGGEIRLWDYKDAQWIEALKIPRDKTVDYWAPAVSPDGQFLAVTTHTGVIVVWDILGSPKHVYNMETQGHFGLTKAVRAVSFSPGGKLLAAAGDSRLIGLYDVASGEQVAIFSGHDAWITSLDWSHTGEYLLSG
ncbi:MAG: hypothetical protein Q9160_000141 [Pyrenula sp. 1 TL-2023]